jgi:hypothetical protein
MTGTYPPWPKPLPMSPTHSTGVRDGDSEHADDRARRGYQRRTCGVVLARGHKSADDQLVDAHPFLCGFDGESAVQTFAQT